MEAPPICTEAEFYQQNFDPQEYLKEFYSMSSSREGASAFMMQNLRMLHKMFSLHFQDIIALDYTDQNCWELEKWLENEAGAFNWEPGVKYICGLGGDREKWAEKQEKLRKKVKQVQKCDVTKANPTGPVSLPPPNCITSTLCMEGACKDLATLPSALRNISTLLTPGGHLVMVTALGDTYYTFNKQAFSCLCLQKHEGEEAVVAAGFEVKFSEVQPYVVDNDCVDFRGVLSLVAQRCPSASV